uniref:ATP-dependent RNA helicase n=1 Tax=Dermatophagoides pteronyssinus TaxID=6956 RepID=A0A6P6XJN6_DERPT|nr:uncharacterized protein LOC113788354 [Dermatophagoides pteronyssinus]
MTTPKACKFVTPKCKNAITPSTTESASLNEVSGCSFDLNSYLVMEDYLYNFFSKDNNDGVNKNTKSEPVKVVYASHMAQAVLGEYLVNEDAKCVSNNCDSSSVPQKGGQNLEHPTTITTYETAKPDLYYDYRSNHPYSCKPCAFYWNKGCINGKNCLLRNQDVIVESCTGSGKTLAYLIPVVERLWLKLHEEDDSWFTYEAFENCVYLDATVRKIHGKINKAKRKQAIMASSASQENCHILLASNLIARGIDFPSVDLVVQFEPAYDVQTTTRNLCNL